MEVLLGFVGGLIGLALIVGIIYAAVKKKLPSTNMSVAIIIALVIAVIAIGWWGGLFETAPSTISFAWVNKWAWGHGPIVLLIAGVVALIVAFFGGAFKSIWFNALAVILVFLFVGSLIGSWFEPSSSKEAEKQAMAQRALIQQSVPCVEAPATSSVPKQIKLLPGEAENIVVGPGQHVDASGINYKLQSELGQGCNGPRVVRARIVNNSTTTAYVNYQVVSD